MTGAWSHQELEHLAAAEELQIASRRSDGTLRPWVPIWVVAAGGHAYVRTWRRRDNGWFGHVLRSRGARIRVPGLQVDVVVDDVGDGTARVRADVDAAYVTKYGRYGTASVDRMVDDAAAAATLRLLPDRGTRTSDGSSARP